MESLKIKNFLTIKEADFKVKRINLIIGQQAVGKSILAKLLYFFRKFLAETYLDVTGIRNLQTEIEVKKQGIKDFTKYFPQYIWINQEFELIYKIDEFEVSIISKKSKEGNESIRLDYSENLSLLCQKAQSEFLSKNREKKDKKNIDKFLKNLDKTLPDIIYKRALYATSPIKEVFKQSVFIPAGRSFFAALQKNVFLFLAKGINIDPFIKDFGSDYEQCKIFYEVVTNPNDDEDDNDLEFQAKIKDLAESVLAGKYKYKDDQDWIEQNGKDINLSQASSGQQEALPMLLILSFLLCTSFEGYTFFIEEPEAHLFPVSQKHIISLIGNMYNKNPHNFVLTTHSPYILTAINNLIFGYEVLKSKGRDKVKKIIDPDCLIKYEDVSAYTINEGVLESIMNDETKLIGASIIDSVSEEFDKVFDSLIELDMSK